MADESKEPGTRRRIKIGRIRIGLNVVVQIVLILFLAAMVNSLAFKHYKRWDFSRDQKYALSDKTKRFLDTLKGKMRITVFFSPSTPITADLQNLLTEYQYAGKGKIDVEQIDPERNLSRAKELFDKYKVVTDESLLVLDYDGRNKTVKASEMADIDQSGMASGEGPAGRRIQRRAGDHQRDDRPCGREKEDPWIRHGSQGTGAFGTHEPDHAAENVYRE